MRQLVRFALAYERQKQMAASLANERTRCGADVPVYEGHSGGSVPFSTLPSDTKAPHREANVESEKAGAILVRRGSVSDSGPATGVFEGDEQERPA